MRQKVDCVFNSCCNVLQRPATRCSSTFGCPDQKRRSLWQIDDLATRCNRMRFG